MQSLMGDHIRIKPLGTRLKALGTSLLILLEFNGLVGALCLLFYFLAYICQWVHRSMLVSRR